MSESLRYDELAAALGRLGFTQDAAEYHGALCGALCARAPQEIDPFKLLEGGGQPDGAAADELLRLRGESANAFNGADLAFTPLLPDDEVALTSRVSALSSWCSGFLLGLASGKPLNLKQCSPEMKEIVRDFTEFTNAGITEEEDAEIEETAYAELVEYIRVGAQLIYMELHENTPDPETVH